MRRADAPHLRMQRGFVLASVLWLLAGLTVVAATVSRYGVSKAQQAQLLRVRSSTETAFASTQAQVLAVLATTQTVRGGRAGASALLKVDGSTLVGDGGSWVRIQDARGLINLNRASEGLLARFFAECGLADDRAQQLAARLHDYIDPDSLSRLNGAEREAYRDAGALAPRNAPFEDVEEVWQVLGMAEHRSAWRDNGCADAMSTTTDGTMNLRTAPYPVLRANNVPEAQARLLSARDIEADDDRASLTARSRESFDEEANPFMRMSTQFPGSHYRVRHLDPVSGLMWEYWVSLNTDRAPQPWLIQSTRLTTLDATQRAAWPSAERAPSLNRLPSLSADAPATRDAAPNDIPLFR
jgi:general secretion pathway protein K